MLASLQRSYAQFITSGAQLFLLFAGLQLDTPKGWLYCLTAMAAVSVFAWLSALNRLRAIRDTPTSKIASAAQGYVELTGRGEQFGDTPLPSKLRQLPCLWYRYQVEQCDSEKNWKTVESGESSDSFLLRDESGECLVDPEQAEITTSHRESWREGDYRYTEWQLMRQDNLYVIGEFRTKSCALEFDSRAELNALLAEWKKDMPALKKRFDLNNDGELDMDEWLLARQAAKREVAERQRVAQLQADIHLIGKPRDGKLFMISNLSQEKLSRRYLFWSLAHLSILLGALFAIGWELQNGGR